jgi:hypothetical protein
LSGPGAEQRFAGGFHPGYHTPSDTPGIIDYGKLLKVTDLAFRTVKSAADSVD